MPQPADNASARAAVDAMLQRDAFSAWLGLSLDALSPGHAVVSMVVRPEMLNGFAISHGGVAFSLADSALAFAANSYGRVAVTIETTVAFTTPAQAGDRLVATATELHRGGRVGHYQVQVTRANTPDDDLLIGHLRGVVYLTNTPIVAGSEP